MALGHARSHRDSVGKGGSVISRGIRRTLGISCEAPKLTRLRLLLVRQHPSPHDIVVKHEQPTWECVLVCQLEPLRPAGRREEGPTLT